MRKTAETGNDFMVPASVIEETFAAGMGRGQGSEQRDRALLIGQGFAVLERKIDEDLFAGSQLPVPAASDGPTNP
jgi:hypothetical protein